VERPVGYLLNTREGLSGEPGVFFDYILASNGLFVRARNPLLAATVLVAPAEIRGLAPLDGRMELTHGKVPKALYDLAISVVAADPRREHYLAVTWDGGYHLRAPAQDGTPGGVSYERLPATVLDIHSHGSMSAFFSGTDNRDEQGLRLYLVIGRLDTLLPEVEMRVGVYGYFAPVSTKDVFDMSGICRVYVGYM